MADRWRLALRALVSICLMTFLASCAAPIAHPRLVRVMLAASSDLNPDGDGRPSPVMVRIYELEDAGDFRQAGFFDLYDHDKRVLGNAALGRMVLAVRPGERLTLCHELDTRSHQLAVLVAYRSIYRARWRAVVDLPAKGDSAWSLTLNADSVRAAALNRKKGNHVLEQ